MPRKSRELRLQQATSLLDAYVIARVQDLYQGRFISDMCYRLGLGKGLSKKQREWLDTLIEEGVPVPKGDPALIAKIESAKEVDGMQHRHTVLGEFLRKIRNGWDLSDKQENFLEIMLNEAEEIRQNGKWSPNEELIKKLQLVIRLSKAKNTWYWQHRPGTAKAYDKVNNWLEWFNQKELRCFVGEAGLEGFEPVDEPHIDEWACNKLFEACKKPLGELKKPKHLPGELRHFRGGPQIALVVGAPILQGGEVGYPVIVDGEQLLTYQLTKRRSRKM